MHQPLLYPGLLLMQGNVANRSANKHSTAPKSKRRVLPNGTSMHLPIVRLMHQARQWLSFLDSENGNAGLNQIEQRFMDQEERAYNDTVEHVVLELMHKHRDNFTAVPILFPTPIRCPISRPPSRASSTMSEHSPSPNHSSPLPFRRPHSRRLVSTQKQTSLDPFPAHSPPPRLILIFLLRPTIPTPPRLCSRLGHRCRLVAETTVSHGTPLRLSSSSKGSVRRRGFDSSRSWSGSPSAGGVDSVADSSNDNDHSGEDSQNQEQMQPFPLSFYPSDSHLDFPNVNSTSYFDEFDANDDPTAGFANSNNYDSNYSMNTMSSSSSNNHNALGDPTSADETLTFDVDVLTSIFGSIIAPSELEDALAANGYDLERAMGWLVDSRAGAAPGGATWTINAQQGQQGPVCPGRMQPMGARVTLLGRGGAAGGIPGRGGMPNTMMGGSGGMGLGGAKQQGQQQYSVAGECLRADCRFSHDLERALCHFWLRGTCARQENCKFLHHLLKDVDMASPNAVLARANVQPGTGPLAAFMGASPYNDDMGMQQDEFPALRYDGANGTGVGGLGRGKKFAAYVNDPSRTRLAAAVKKPAPLPHHQLGDDASANGTAPRIQERPWICCS
ncbi:hypothetical protein D9613_012196 [Agrocybe pediades]|uniref:C3H1-type domain-containing protein n=1 Tax=Agrocybe pediades TaxID=84607 RepID=A0A8H4VTS2_9AGAR|nr:hypothetical protein D9613_012196 [Agrocybe pediades]